MSVFYEDLAPKEFLERLNECPVGYLPLGTIEWHGPHLPLGTDLFEGKDLFERTAEKYGGIVFPPLFLGPDRMTTDGVKEYVGMDNWEVGMRCPKYERQQFPGSCYRVDDETYALILKNIIKQAARAGFKVLAGVAVANMVVNPLMNSAFDRFGTYDVGLRIAAAVAFGSALLYLFLCRLAKKELDAIQTVS